MSLYNQGVTLRALLENPELISAPKLKSEDKKDDLSDIDPFQGQSAFLGPQLWDKTLPYDGEDFKLEFMDLDEFLQENGIPLNLESSLDILGSPERPQTVSPSTPTSPVTLLPPQTSPTRSPQYMSDGSDGGCRLSPSSTPRHPPSPAQALRACPVYSSAVSCPAVPQTQRQLSHDSDSHDEPHLDIPSPDVSLAQLPGQEGFDPRKRIFSEEELRPQPMIKKSKKVFVPDDHKDDKYWARRKKNNVAAKRSRDARRCKENQIAMRACFLEKQNTQLRLELEQSRQQNEELKKRLEKYEST